MARRFNQPAYAYPPFCMNAAEAARYLGISQTSFLDGVKRGRYPAPGSPTPGGRRKVWLTEALERCARESIFGAEAASPNDPEKNEWDELLK